MNNEELKQEARAWLKDNAGAVDGPALEEMVAHLAAFADQVSQQAVGVRVKEIADELDDALTENVLFGRLEKRIEVLIHKLRTS